MVAAPAGALEVETKQDAGTTFTIWLPAVLRSSVTLADPAAAIDPKGYDAF